MTNSSWRNRIAKVTIGVGMLTVSLGLVVLLAWATSTDFDDILKAFAQLNSYSLALILFLSFSNQALATLKWQFGMHRQGFPRQRYGKLLFILVSSTLVGQFIPQQVAQLSLRSLGARLIAGSSEGSRCVYSVVFDQMLDVMGPAAFLAASMLLLIGIVGPGAGIAWGLTAYAGAYLLLIWRQSDVIGLYILVASLPRRLVAWCSRATPPTNEVSMKNFSQSLQLTSNALMMLSLLNLIRYSLLAARLWVIAVALGFPLGLTEAYLLLPVVPLAMGLGLTPGALGIMEAGFVGEAIAYGLPANGALECMLVMRGTAFLALSLITATSGLWIFFKRDSNQLTLRN